MHGRVFQVLDRNDHAPVFDSSPFEVSVSESVPTHTRLVQARATDEDFGSNGEIRYSLSSKSSHLSSLFTVDPYNGWVSLQGSLDREQKASYELEVVASDNGAPSSRSATTTVVIQVEDANDSPPEFSQLHYSAAVNEGALPGTIIFQLITEDKDEEATREVEFYIISGDDKGQFQVSSDVMLMRIVVESLALQQVLMHCRMVHVCTYVLYYIFLKLTMKLQLSKDRTKSRSHWAISFLLPAF